MALPGTRQYLDFEDGSGYQSPLSAGYNYATRDGGIGADQYYANIKDYVTNTLANEALTDAQRAENIRNAAAEYGVSYGDISKATGYDMDVVNAYLDPNRFRVSTQQDNTGASNGALSVATGAVTTPNAATRDEINNLYSTLLKRDADIGGLDYWANSGMSLSDIRDRFLGSEEYLGLQNAAAQDTSTGVTQDQSDYYANINDYVTSVLSSDKTAEEKAADIISAAQTYGVSNEDIAKATGYSLEDVNNYLGTASVTTTANQGALTKVSDAQIKTDTTTGGAGVDLININGYFAENPDVAAAYVSSGASESMTPEQFAEKHWNENGRYENRTGPNGEAPPAADKMYDYRGNEYDANAILKLASQIIPNLGKMAGGAFATQGQSIGFDFNEAKRILGRDPSAAEQVVLDMARGMLDNGITDISQLEVKDITEDYQVNEIYDEIGNPTGRYSITFADPYNSESGGFTRELTPEEAARVTKEEIYDSEGGITIRKTANDILSGKAIYSGDKLLSELSAYNLNVGSPITVGLGGTSTGKGGTEYQLVVNPTTGKMEFMTYGTDNSFAGKLAPILTIASFIPGVQPFAMIANAALAASQGNTIGALASLAGAGGFTNVATALNVANAIQNKDVFSLAQSLLSNPTISNVAGTTMLTDTISLKDVGTAANIIMAADKGDFVGVLNGASNLTGSSDLKTAAAAATVVQGVINKNPTAIINGIMQLNTTLNAAETLNDKDVVTKLVDNVTNGSITDSGEQDLEATVYAAARNAGATDEEALNASKAITNTSASSGADTKETITTGDAKTDIMEGVSVMDDDPYAGLSDAIKTATENNTLNISNDQADDLDQAAAMAGARGFTTFTYDGKTYNISASSQDIAKQVANAEISVATKFKDAYRIARDAFGPGAVFEWNGKKYSTDTREENPSLAAASDQIRYAEMGAGGGRGSYANYDPKAAADAFAKLNPDIVNQDMPTVTFGTMDDFLLAGGLSGEYVVVDDKISKSLIDPVVKTIGTVTRAGGSFLDNMAGGLQAVNVIDKNSGIIKIANDMQKWGSDRMGDYLIDAEKNVINRVNKVEGFDDKFIELGKALWDNPSAILTLGANEVFEEGVPLLTGGAALKYGGKLLALGADAFMNAWEAGGANYNDTKKAAVAAGMNEEEAHTAAQKSAGGAAAVASVLGPAADMPWLKRAGSVTSGTAETGAKVVAKETGKAAGREAITEYPEELAASVMSDYFATGTFDLNKGMTQATVGSVVAGKAVGTITVVSEVTSAGNSTAEIINSTTVDPDQAANLTNIVSSSMKPGVDLKTVGSDIVTAMEASGMNTAQAQNVANTAVAEQVLTNINQQGGDLNINDLNIAVGTDGQGNAVTLGDFIGSSVTDTGGSFYVAPDIFIGTNSKGQAVTVGDLSNLVTIANTKTGASTDTSTSTTVTSGGVAETDTKNNVTGSDTVVVNDGNTGVKTETTTNADTGSSSTVTTDTKTGSETTSTTDATTGTDTKTSTDTSTGTESVTSTDATTGVTTKTDTNVNTGVTTQTTSDTATGTNTQTTTDTKTNTETTTTTNTNTNVTTQVTTDTTTGVTTTSTTDTNGTVTSEVTTDTTNNTETTVDTNTDTNTQTTTVVDLNTNTVISTTVNEDPVIKKIDPVETIEPEEDEEEKKKKKAKRLLSGAPAAAGLMGGDITGLPPQFLKSFVTGEKKIDPIAQVRQIQEEMEREAMLQNIDPRLAAVLKERMGGQQPAEDLSGLDAIVKVFSGGGFDPQKAEESEYYAYGQEDPIESILGGGSSTPPMAMAAGGYVEPLMAQGGMALPLLAKRGGLTKMAEGREDFRDGKHVAGEGDGQSDDIPAMLADGEFVFPADVVSALGNGSTKAGTDKLYEMMHEIRKRARSTGKKDLPPPALKSPLDYLKSKR